LAATALTVLVQFALFVLHPVFTVPSPVPALFAYAVYVHAAMLHAFHSVTLLQLVGVAPFT